MSRFIVAIIVLSLAICTVALPNGTSSRPANSPNKITPSINGISLGSYLPKVRQKLGKPLRIRRESYDHYLGMGAGRRFEYDGMKAQLIKPPGAKEFHVWAITVTSKKWLVSPRLKIGMNLQEVINLFGVPREVEQKTEYEILWYALEELRGWFQVKIKDGKVIEIEMAEDWA
jgi:hypothetical protein